MKERLVIEEILDSLPPDDPRAVQSRRDLRRINVLMGNYRWISDQLRTDPFSTVTKWTEIGAGSGDLAGRIEGQSGGSFEVEGVDFAPRPRGWPERWDWHRGDLFAYLEEEREGATPGGLIANLFLHHFEDKDLRRLGAFVNGRCRSLLVSEPARYGVFRTLAFALFPFVNEVTRHDMQVSIAAGFRPGEVAQALGLSEDWRIRETVTAFGAYRLAAWKDQGTYPSGS